MKYKIRPKAVDAFLFTGLWNYIPLWAQGAIVSMHQGATIASMIIQTKRGMLTAWSNQDYIVKYPDNSIDVIRKDAFEAMYEVADTCLSHT